VRSGKEGDKIQIADQAYYLPANVTVQRSKNDLKIRLISDTSSIDYTVESIASPIFIYGNILTYGVGYLVDLTNPKRFYYGATIYLNQKDPSRVINARAEEWRTYWSKDFLKSKGDINLVLSSPYVNGFFLQPQGEASKSSMGFYGLTLGLEYYYETHRYVGMNASGVLDFPTGIPFANVDQEGYVESMSSTSASVTHNHKIKRFHFGYGLNYATNVWEWSDDLVVEPGSLSTPAEGRKRSKSFGLTLNTFHQFTNSFLFGIVYRPSFLRISPTTEFKYEHLISLDAGWRIPLRKSMR
jgi:hypothetical protein